MNPALQKFARETAEQRTHIAVVSLASIIAARHQPAMAVLAYGSALRDAAPTTPTTTLIDYYVLTQDFAGISPRFLSRVLCRLLPPNVYYVEAEIEGQTCRAKYAVVPIGLLAEKLLPDVSNPYFWVRFAQPMRLVWAVDDIARERIWQLLARAMQTAQGHARQIAPGKAPGEQWVTLFENTYRTELRPESANRAKLIVDTQQDHYLKLANLAPRVVVSKRSWFHRRWQGKLLSIGRLLKAAFTFQGGVDYAAWKIKRHSGVDVEVKNWHRRHPILASLTLLPLLLRKGGLK